MGYTASPFGTTFFHKLIPSHLLEGREDPLHYWQRYRNLVESDNTRRILHHETITKDNISSMGRLHRPPPLCIPKFGLSTIHYGTGRTWQQWLESESFRYALHTIRRNFNRDKSGFCQGHSKARDTTQAFNLLTIPQGPYFLNYDLCNDLADRSQQALNTADKPNL